MLLYVLICLSLSLTGVAGLQMMYMLYMETVDRQRRKRLSELERACRQLHLDLAKAENLIVEQKTKLQIAGIETNDEAWADVIEEC